ncbi:MAG: dephospho-CoA kinase [Sterolibacterium sp.]|jgi:dephospho-CoA kinase|nr:dephospho-CoA kinase [Sterolibacterium sp.]
MTHTTTSDGRVLGLTGGIGSGKSAAAALFRELGIPVIDVDAIAHELTAPGGAAMEAIRKDFGERMITPQGALDRAAMRQLAFSDASAKLRLEAILHPMIGVESRRRCRAALETAAPYAIMEIPLLIESGTYRNRVARIAVVDCSEETQIRRVMQRSQMRREDVERIMAAQVQRAERCAVANDLIDNEGELAQLRPQVAALHQKYLDMLAAKKSLAGG